MAIYILADKYAILTCPPGCIWPYQSHSELFCDHSYKRDFRSAVIVDLIVDPWTTLIFFENFAATMTTDELRLVPPIFFTNKTVLTFVDFYLWVYTVLGHAKFGHIAIISNSVAIFGNLAQIWQFSFIALNIDIHYFRVLKSSDLCYFGSRGSCQAISAHLHPDQWKSLNLGVIL